MTDEEKKAMIKLNRFSNMTTYWKQEEYTNSEIDNYIKTVLNLIEKQSKEIQRLEAKKYMYNADTGEISQIPLNDNYINKDKIKEFIKEELPDDEICECCDIIDVNGVEIKQKLKSLIEKE